MTLKEKWDMISSTQEFSKIAKINNRSVRVIVEDPESLSGIISLITKIDKNHIIDTVFMFDRRRNIPHIVTTFRKKKIEGFGKVGSSMRLEYPALKELEGLLYDGELEVFDLFGESDSEEISFRWNLNMALAVMTNTSLYYARDYQFIPIGINSKDVNRMCGMMVAFNARVDENNRLLPFNPNEVEKTLERNKQMVIYQNQNSIGKKARKK